MDFETIDWNAEAERVRRAFGVAAPCEIHPGHRTIHFQGTGQSLERWGEFHLGNGFDVSVWYWPEWITFKISEMADGSTSLNSASVRFTWDGTFRRCNYDRSLDSTKELVQQLAKGLYHLGLLTPEAEVALEISVSGHQKLEWTLEYERRYEL